MTATVVRRLRCYSGCLLRDGDLINVRPPENGRTDYVVASGPCPRCGACMHVIYNEVGPADRVNTYGIVGLKVERMTRVRCTARCAASTRLECKCSCGGEQHGVTSGGSER